MNGTLFGVGVGPGDPELLTVKAVRCLEDCDVLAIPDPEKGRSTAYSIAKAAVSALDDKESISVSVPMTHDRAVVNAGYRKAADLVESFLRQGKNVAFITLGDPSVYSTYVYLQELVAEDGFATRMIPGVPSFCAAAARLNMSLAERNQMLHIIPSSHGIEKALELPGNKIFMKAGSKLPQVKARLQEAGMDVKMVENCGMPEEHVYESAEVIPDDAGYFSLFIAKERK